MSVVLHRFWLSRSQIFSTVKLCRCVGKHSKSFSVNFVTPNYATLSGHGMIGSRCWFSSTENTFDFQIPCSNRYVISQNDVLPMEKYISIRPKILELRTQLKRLRRVEIGPNAHIAFQSRTLVWIQIQEMLFIERGGEKQAEDELISYNPLIPNGKCLTFVLMLGFENAKIRRSRLSQLGHIENCVFLSFNSGNRIFAKPLNQEKDSERTTIDGKTSAVHFLKFDFHSDQLLEFRKASKALIGIEHENYGHMSNIPPNVLNEMKSDLEF